MKQCFSYVRFSTKVQEEGSTDYRQDETFERVVAEYGWTPRDDLKIRLAGVSAYKGKNLPYLENVKQLVKDGTIPQGTVMVIETFDRYSRRKLSEVFPLLWEMLASGLEIWVEEMHLTKDTLDDEEKLSKVMREIKNAYKYSDKLSFRVNSALKKRTEMILNGERFNKDGSRILLNHLPSWIDKQSWTVKPNGNIIRTIFEMYLNGSGPAAISRKFNDDKTPTVSGVGKWGQGYIYRLLSNRQLIGELEVTNGDNTVSIPNFFPLVITSEMFDRVQTKLSDNAGKRPAAEGQSRIHNLFNGLAFCSVCNEAIRVRPAKGVLYMDCQGKFKGGKGCNHKAVKFQPLEDSFVKILGYKADEFVQDESGATVNTNIQILTGQLVGIQKQIETCNTAIEDAITNNRLNVLVIIEKKLSGLKVQESEMKRKIETEGSKKVTLKGSTERFHKILERVENLTTDNEFRSVVQSWVRETIEVVKVDRGAQVFSVQLKNGNFIKMDFAGNVIECKSFVALFGKNVENLATTYQEQTFKAS